MSYGTIPLSPEDKPDSFVLLSTYEKLKSENAKLRELVKDFFDVPCQCIKCEHYNYEEDRCDLHDLARELGVGVDG